MSKESLFRTKLVLALGMLLSGCVGFTEDWFTCSDASYSKESFADSKLYPFFNAARITNSGKLDIDTKHDSVTIVMETFGGCVKKGSKYTWDSDFYFADTKTFAYSFRGDTLLLTDIYVPDETEVGIDEPFEQSLILVGGDAGELEGIWKLTQCRYRDGKKFCGNDGYTEYFLFNENRFEYRVADQLEYDYMQTHFVSELFEFMVDSSTRINLNHIFYHDDTEYWQEKAKIDIKKKTDQGMNFVYDGHVFDLNVDHASYGDSVAVTLKAGEKTCTGDYYETMLVPDEVCSVDYADDLYEQDSGAMKYRRQNSSEFEECINDILGRESE